MKSFHPFVTPNYVELICEMLVSTIFCIKQKSGLYLQIGQMLAFKSSYAVFEKQAMFLKPCIVWETG